MTFMWNPWAIPGLAAVAVAVALAITVYSVGPQRTLNRRLAWLLAVDAVDVFASFSVSDHLTNDPSAVFGWGVAHFVADAFVIAAYLGFIGVALDTPLVRPFRSAAAPWILAAIAAGAGALFVVFPEALMTNIVPTGYRPFAFGYVWGPWVWALWAVVAGAFTYGFVAALHTWLRARRRGRGPTFAPYLVAFGTRDVGWAVLFGTLVYWGLGGTPSLQVAAFLAVWFAAVLLVYVPLLAYAILRRQILDIDLRIKWTLSRGTLAGIIVFVFLVVTQLVENLASDTLGLLAGSIAAGSLLFFFQPLLRLSERFAHAAMPHVQDTAEYRFVRKREVYRATLEGAFLDGEVSDKERDMLARLQDSLGLSATEARAIEREVVAQQGVA